MDLARQIGDRFRDALAAAFGEAYRDADPILRPAQDPKFGDYQANLAMSLGKTLGLKPRDVAQKIADALDLTGLCDEPPTIAGPGFINIRLSNDALGRFATAMLRNDRLGIEPDPTPQTVVIDYSSPNVAKEMHVGHLRSTVIGDALARTLEFLGHNVVRQNHLGDWGTQFGMLIERLEELGVGAEAGVKDLDAFYRESKQRFDTDPAFAERARRRVVGLQGGDPRTLERWRGLVDTSRKHFNEAYHRLSITLTDRDIAGESTYNDKLKPVAEELARSGLARESDGALCIFIDGHDDPLMVRKSDGGFGYAATDLAAIRYRVRELRGNRLIYVVDARQSDHFIKLFKAARLAGWVGENISTEHVKFGTILGEDGKPFKTRAGDTVKLADLLDEAEERAAKIVREKSPTLSEGETKQIAHTVGIGAVKYSDLAADRIKDYVFSWDRMLAMEGNTAPYLQYAYARIRSIFRKAQEDGVAGAKGGSATVPQHTDAKCWGTPGLSPSHPSIVVTHHAERALALKLAQLAPTVVTVAHRLEPHHLCTWLFELASSFSAFYEGCPVLKADTDTQRASRLALCDLTARAIQRGLALLGIDVVERM